MCHSAAGKRRCFLNEERREREAIRREAVRASRSIRNTVKRRYRSSHVRGMLGEITTIWKIAPRLVARGDHDGEFDPGSERTLAARLKHASRANGPPSGGTEAADG